MFSGRRSHGQVLPSGLFHDANRLLPPRKPGSKFELAVSLLESYAARLCRTESITQTERLTYLKLMEKYRNTDPFKMQLLLGKNRRADPSHGKMMDLAVE